MFNKGQWLVSSLIFYILFFDGLVTEVFGWLSVIPYFVFGWFVMPRLVWVESKKGGKK